MNNQNWVNMATGEIDLRDIICLDCWTLQRASNGTFVLFYEAQLIMLEEFLVTVSTANLVGHNPDRF